MANLFNPPDFKLTVGKFTWNVHEQVLAGHSTFFTAMCSGRFQEAEAHEATLHDDNPLQIAQMLMWMYSGECTVTRTGDSMKWPQMSLDKFLEAGCQREGGDAAVEEVFTSTKTQRLGN